MKKIFLVFSLLSITSLFALNSYAKDLYLTGSINIEEKNIPVVHGTIVIYELRARFFRMPSVRIINTAMTNYKGEFDVKIKDIKGDLQIVLIKDKCEWKSKTHDVAKEEYQKDSSIDVNFSTKYYACEE